MDRYDKVIQAYRSARYLARFGKEPPAVREEPVLPEYRSTLLESIIDSEILSLVIIYGPLFACM
jgi:hypothetical protein